MQHWPSQSSYSAVFHDMSCRPSVSTVTEQRVVIARRVDAYLVMTAGDGVHVKQ